MKSESSFDPKYALLGVVTILVAILLLVVLPDLVKKKLAAIGSAGEANA